MDSFDVGIAEGTMSEIVSKNPGESSALVQSIFAQFTAYSRLFHATKRHAEVGGVNAVDLKQKMGTSFKTLTMKSYPNSASLQPVRRFNGPINILREYCARQAIGSIVCLPDDVLIVVELDNNSDRSEDLLAHDLHAGLAVGEDGRFDEIPFGAVTLATNVACGAL